MLTATGNAAAARVRLLLPAGAKSVVSVMVDGEEAKVESERVRDSLYAVVDVELNSPVRVEVRYAN